MDAINVYYCILRGQIKGLNCSITIILFEVGGFRIVIGYSYRTLGYVVIGLWF